MAEEEAMAVELLDLGGESFGEEGGLKGGGSVADIIFKRGGDFRVSTTSV